MTQIRLHQRLAALMTLGALVLLASPAAAGNHNDSSRPVTVTFTKWGIAAPPPPAPQPPFGLLTGIAGGAVDGEYVGEVLGRQISFNGEAVALEAMYGVRTAACAQSPEDCGRKGDRSFRSVIRGGQSAAGAGRLEGVILSGWRTGARLEVTFQRYPASHARCLRAGAPPNSVCFVGTMAIDRPDKN